MTLLINEIFVPGNLQRSLIVLAADRLVTVPEGVSYRFHSYRKKLFKIPYLNAGVGYFGLAQFEPNNYFSDWLDNFIRTTKAKSPEEFAWRLCEELNRVVPEHLLKQNPSGFHVCGYNAGNYPQLWFITNIRRMEGNDYKAFDSKYLPSEDFLRKDAHRLGFDGTKPTVPKKFIQCYVNGDLRAFHSSSKMVHDSFVEMVSQKKLERPKQISDFEEIAEWKIKEISTICEQSPQGQTIGGDVDSIVLLPSPTLVPSVFPEICELALRPNPEAFYHSSGSSLFWEL